METKNSVEKIKVDEIIIFKSTGGKFAVKRSDKKRPSRYFNNIKEARAYVSNHYIGEVSESV